MVELLVFNSLFSSECISVTSVSKPTDIHVYWRRWDTIAVVSFVL